MSAWTGGSPEPPGEVSYLLLFLEPFRVQFPHLEISHSPMALSHWGFTQQPKGVSLSQMLSGIGLGARSFLEGVVIKCHQNDSTFKPSGEVRDL